MISRKMAVVALEDRDYYDEVKREIVEVRRNFIKEINKIDGVKAFDSYANFVFIHMGGYDIQRIKDKLAKKGLLIRLWTENGHLAMRVTLGPKKIMDEFITLMTEICREEKV